MQALGTVIEILDSSMILVRSDKRPFTSDEILQVFAEVTDPNLLSKHGLTQIQVPKGEVRIIAAQELGYYLAETFRTYVSRERVIDKTPSLLSGILGPSPEVVRERVPGPQSAALGQPTVAVDITRQVKVGDRIGTA
jgi:hypothetical protein